MRLTAQQRGGFYPAHAKAVDHLTQYLRPPTKLPFSLLDPCAGEGAAIGQLAHSLGCPPGMTYAIELDDSRAATLVTTLPGAHILAPASFFGCRASPSTFSIIWLNPPFDHAYGGNRVEEQFLLTATDWLMPGGVLAFVCPEDVMDDYSDARGHFATYYENCRIVPFPDPYRPYKEVVVLAHKRRQPTAKSYGYGGTHWEEVLAPEGFVYHIPPGPGPKFFLKAEPTETELQRMLADSPLRSHFHTPPTYALPSPPLALGIGHVALLLASGHLDGIVEPEGRPPHVVRGSSRKCKHVSDVTETVNDDGNTTTKTTISERIELVVRTVGVTGRLQTYLETNTEEDQGDSS